MVGVEGEVVSTPTVNGSMVGAVDRISRSVRVVAATPDAVWTDGKKVERWELSRFFKNPVVLFDHDFGGLPIGRATDVRVEDDGSLTMTIVFGSIRSERANQIFESVAAGMLRGVSVGFAWKGPGVAELVEVSFVSVPKDENALVAASFAGRMPAANFDANTPTAYIDDDPRDPTPFIDPMTQACRCEVDLRGRPCGCFRTGAVNARSGPKGLRAPCTPADAERDRTRTDASEDIITKARAARDARARDAWKETQR